MDKPGYRDVIGRLSGYSELLTITDVMQITGLSRKSVNPIFSKMGTKVGKRIYLSKERLIREFLC